MVCSYTHFYYSLLMVNVGKETNRNNGIHDVGFTPQKMFALSIIALRLHGKKKY